MTDGRTHYAGCWRERGHHECATDLLEQAYLVLLGFLARYDAENPGAAMEPDVGCLHCTAGATPDRHNTGLCPMHKAERLVAKLNWHPTDEEPRDAD